MLDRAALAALRGVGHTEPNPIVGCVIGGAERHATAHHRAFGGPHAEINALAAAREAGIDPYGATAWVTLEPCNHQGKTGPCAQALIDAGIARVVAANPDPNPIAKGGFDRLRAAGVDCRFSDASTLAHAISQPFITAATLERPFVVAKWAQTIDGRVATSVGESHWITGPRARRDAHRLRTRCGAILTGIGTAITDNPLLTPRGVSLRNTPTRIVLDPRAQLPTDGRLARSASESPLVVVISNCGHPNTEARASTLEALGITVLRAPERPSRSTPRLDLAETLRTIRRELGTLTIMTEAGGGVLGQLLDQRLIDCAWIYTAPKILGDPAAMPAFRASPLTKLSNATTLRLMHTKRLGDDLRTIYLASPTSD